MFPSSYRGEYEAESIWERDSGSGGSSEKRVGEEEEEETRNKKDPPPLESEVGFDRGKRRNKHSSNF